MKIVILDGYGLNPGDLSWEPLKALADVTIYDRTAETEIIERIGGAEIVLTNKTPLRRETLEKVPSVKYIGVLATGYNVVDVKAARDLDKIVTNIPAYSTDSVAQMVFAHLLTMCHHVWSHSEAVRDGAWAKSIDFCFWNYPLTELTGKTIGIIGLGRIGQAVAKIAVAFGMEVLAYGPRPKKELEHEHLKFVSLDELYRDSDVISLHCPLFDGTAGMINKDSIQKMKDGVILINTSRGQLIVEEDLAEALNSGKVGGAGLDVLSSEPPAADNPLTRAKNCQITPHIAWAPIEARQRLMSIAVENVKAYMAGQPIHVVN